MNYIAFLLTIFVSMSAISGEIAESNLKNETKVCETNVSPLTLGVNICPITDEEFDEDDLLECTCVLPTQSSESFQKLKNKKIGDVFKNMFNESKKSFVDVVRVASQSGIRADHPENNKCSMDAFSEIVKNRMRAPARSSVACNSELIEANTKKYFNSDLGSIISELSKPPQAVVSAADPLSSLFIQPMEKRDHKQCLSPMGNGFMDMVTKGSVQSRVTSKVASKIIENIESGKSIEWIIQRRSMDDDYFRKLPDNLKQEIIMRMKQLKTVGKPDTEIKAEFSKLAFSSTAIEGAIDNLQNHCGFMMTSLVDLMCQKNEVGDIANSEFIEKQLGHDPYEVDLENENWYAAQEMHCKSELNQSKEKNKDESCADNYKKDVVELIVPPIRLTSYDSLLACNDEFLGSEDYLKNHGAKQDKKKIQNETDGTAGICEMLTCSNHLDMLAEKDVTCEKRDGNLSYKDLINEIANIKCSSESNKYCQNGKPNPILENIQKMFITECRITGCMEDKVLADKFQDQLKTNPDLKRIFQTPKEELVSMGGAEQKFWDRFSDELQDLEDMVGSSFAIAPSRETSSEKNEVTEYKNVLRDDYSKLASESSEGDSNPPGRIDSASNQTQSLPARMGEGGAIASPDEVKNAIASGSNSGAISNSNTSGATLSRLDPNTIEQGKAILNDAIKRDALVENIGQEDVIELPPSIERIDVVKELIEYKKKNPNFKVGRIIVLKQGEDQARLIPLFDEFGFFKSYGVNSDRSLQRKMVLRKEGPIMLKFLNKSESLHHELDIATLRVSSN